MAICPLCDSKSFCAVPVQLPGRGSVRCTRKPGHTGEHAACGENPGEHPIFRWSPSSKKQGRYRSRATRRDPASST